MCIPVIVVCFQHAFFFTPNNHQITQHKALTLAGLNDARCQMTKFCCEIMKIPIML